MSWTSVRQIFWGLVSATFLVITATALLSLGGLVPDTLDQTDLRCDIDNGEVICLRGVEPFWGPRVEDQFAVQNARIDEVCDSDGTSCRYPVMMQTSQGEIQLTDIDPATKSLSEEIAAEINALVDGSQGEPIEYSTGPHWFLFAYYSLFALLGLGMAVTAAYGLFKWIRKEP
ncbi:MAG: hypothetical protein AAF633_03250 [Chloroflexota bacterium]